MTDTAKGGTGFGHRAWLFAAGLVVAQAALFAWNLEREYGHVLDTEYARLADAARIADESISGSLRAIDLLLRDVAAEHDRHGTDPVAMAEFMVTRARAMPELRTVVLTDAEGVITATTRPEIQGWNIHDRPYYVQARQAAAPDRTLFSPLTLAKPTDVQVIFATRNLPAHHGQWTGIVSATLEIKMFQALLASIVPTGSSTVIALVDQESRIISRQPDSERYVGFDLSQGGFLEGHRATGQKLSFHRLPTLTEGIDKIGAVRTVANGSFTVMVTKPVSEALAPWRGQAINQGIGFFVLAAAVFALTGLAIRHHRRETRANALTALAQDARRTSDERLELATAGAHVGVWDYDLETGFCVYNAEMLRLYGLQGDGSRMTFDDWQTSVHAGDRERASAEVRSAAGGERSLDTEFRIVRPDGTVRHLKSVAQVYRDPANRPIRMVGLNFDITESKQFELALKEAKDQAEAMARSLTESEHFTRAVADNLPGMVGYWDINLRCRFANRHYVEWFGRTSEQMIGLSLPEIQGPALFALNEPYIQGALQGQHQYFERTLIKTDGSIGYTWAQYIPDKDQQGRVKGFFVLVTDITAIKQTELRLKETNEQLMAARDRADAANHAKSAFLAMMSHEIRTPITGVLGMADLLRQTPLTGEQAGYLDTLAASTNTLLTILNDVLDISKIEAGKVVFEAVAFPLHDAVLDTIALFKGAASSKALTLAPHLADDLPPRVIGDPARFKQLLFNLTSNAIKFTERGGVDLRLSVTARDGSALTVRVDVEDTGIGIAPDQMSLLFQPFTQLGTSTARRFGGTGLGLVITQRLIEMMGGAIGVSSRPGEGSRFWFWLPFRVASDRATPTVGKASPASATRSLSILLAEDNRINQMLVRTMLQKAGHIVAVVENGRLAVESVTTGAFDVVLMDMQMPEMDGEDATRAIRALPMPQSRLPIIALTADAMPEHCTRYLAAGVNDLVAKPIDWTTLHTALAAHTGDGVPEESRNG